MNLVSAPQAANKMVWAGRIVSAIPVLLFLFTLTFGFLKPAMAAQGFAHYGYPKTAMLPITIVQVLVAVIYAIPRTAVLGAILMTGYLGGATATHVRVSEPFIFPIIVGILVWLGLYFRDARVRALVPLRTLP
ncbi:MAG: DoxX family protein [Candidatus Sulfotelmatobacter sp.]